MKTVDISLCQLHEAPWNANRMDEAMAARLKESISRYGVVENLVVRQLEEKSFEVISGNQRLSILRQAGFLQAPCVVVEVDDAHARLLAQALNHIQGEDDLGLRAELLRQVLEKVPQKEILAILPETACSLQSLSSLGSETIAEYLQKHQAAQAARLKHMQFQLTATQLATVEKALTQILERIQAQEDNPNLRGNALYFLCKNYLDKENQK